MHCDCREREIVVDLGPDDYVVLVNLIVNGREYGQVPIVYRVPADLPIGDREEFARGRIAEITSMLQKQGERLVADLPEGRMELRMTETGDLAWLGEAPDTPEGL